VLRRQRNRIALLRLTPITAAQRRGRKGAAADAEGGRKETPSA